MEEQALMMMKMARDNDEQRRGLRRQRRQRAKASEAATADGEGFRASNLRQTATADPTTTRSLNRSDDRDFKVWERDFGERERELTVSEISERERVDDMARSKDEGFHVVDYRERDLVIAHGGTEGDASESSRSPLGMKKEKNVIWVGLAGVKPPEGHRAPEGPEAPEVPEAAEAPDLPEMKKSKKTHMILYLVGQ
ncbi:hypothetical protein Scep_012253 [Stephania cephalantha]|uniref:Uncharacterized protein n=1 Tax=Stephania cephalantha TaxID=152367 RepID=A0AAP0JFN0_9MAGN